MDLKRLRQDKGLSQVEIAEEIGVHVNTYILWERGAGKPTPENMEKLKAVLWEGKDET
jgi:transcriptional regulator with XRE-family HTH domain